MPVMQIVEEIGRVKVRLVEYVILFMQQFTSPLFIINQNLVKAYH